VLWRTVLYSDSARGDNPGVSVQVVRAVGLAATTAYAVFVVWLFAAQPRTLAEVSGGIAAQIGAYQVDEAAFEAGLAFFRRDQFVEARSAFTRADPAQRDPRTQFYIAYSYYRQGWGRLYNDDELFRHGLAAVDRAIAVAPAGRVEVAEGDLQMHSSDELRAELERGLTRDLSDLNPLRVLRTRK
jgi:tetratricopeptide (TPR) repeat protein